MYDFYVHFTTLLSSTTPDDVNYGNYTSNHFLTWNVIQSACQWVSYSQENKNVAVEKLAGDYYCLDGQSWPRIYYTSTLTSGYDQQLYLLSPTCLPYFTTFNFSACAVFSSAYIRHIDHTSLHYRLSLT